jgi:hypothetical protein
MAARREEVLSLSLGRLDLRGAKVRLLLKRSITEDGICDGFSFKYYILYFSARPNGGCKTYIACLVRIALSISKLNHIFNGFQRNTRNLHRRVWTKHKKQINRTIFSHTDGIEDNM